MFHAIQEGYEHIEHALEMFSSEREIEHSFGGKNSLFRCRTNKIEHALLVYECEQNLLEIDFTLGEYSVPP